MKPLFYIGAVSLACASCSRENADPSPAAKPVAGFTIPATVSAQLPVQVQNTSTNATTSVWAWGDGTSSAAWSPSHIYTQAGKVRLLLTVTGAGGTDTISKIVSVTATPKPVASFTAPTNVKALDGIAVRNTSTSATSYVWTWGDGSTSTDTDPTHVYSVLGNRRLRLTATGPGGNDTISKIITVVVPSAPTNVAGNYKGWLYYYNNGFRWKRDTTLTFGVVSTRVLLVFNRNAEYQDTPSTAYFSSNWFGHSPNRNNYTFYAPASGKPTILQKAWNSDSVYVTTHIGGLASYEDYEFYGKKLP